MDSPWVDGIIAAPMNQRPIIIAVIGGSNAAQKDLDAAYQVGLELAKRGAIVLCGGMTGVMEAVCKGAKEAGGTTVGIMPGNNVEDANDYIDIAIPTGLGYARNAIVAGSGRAIIAIDGAYGTLSEIGHGLGDGTPIVGLNTWRLIIDGKEDTTIERANNPLDAVEKALAYAEARRV
ncbi:uncharacterized protein METZ01_LOCUS217154 [marine metagenome]|uniref:TIGR00725 family protein n=1 Tax=marine metagenome TaxID=408172 RepID=A0A382FMQ0_9ZZZZ